jgi:hypothetical protein
MLRTNDVFKLDRIIPYTILVLALVFDQAMLAPTQPLIADDTWHYKWASDILAQKPIYWFGCDANRIFPDLLFSIVAGVMPDGQSFQFWLINYFTVSAFSLGISLIFLSYALYSDNSRRMAFVAICCTFFAIITTFIPFWSFGVTAPGIHGGSLSAVIVSIALFTFIANSERMHLIPVVILMAILALLVMSNRYLVVCVVLPLIMSAQLVVDRANVRHGIILSIIISTACGLLLLHLLNFSYFYHLVAPGNQPSLADVLSLKWWIHRLPKEVIAYGRATARAQVFLGLSVMLTAVMITFWQGRRLNSLFSNREAAFKITSAISTILAILFIIVMVDDEGDWRYRYLIVPFFLSVFALSAMVVPLLRAGRTYLSYVLLSVACITSAGVALTFDTSTRALEAKFQIELTQLSSVLAAHDGMGFHSGFGDYWTANDVNVRSANIRILAIGDQDAHLYNTNGLELCETREFSFVILREDDEWPGVDTIIKNLGLPLSRQTIRLDGFEKALVLFYDPNVIDKLVVQPGKAAVRRVFPNFECPGAAPR